MQLQIFSNPVFGQVRTTTDEKGNVWFIGKDVAEALRYVNPEKAIREHIDQEDKGVSVLGTPGGNQRVTTINESGLYSLVFSSKLPQAHDFKRWVTREVLPQIRKTGGYIPVAEADDEKQILCKALMILQRTVEQQAPQVAFAKAVSASEDCILVRDLAKLITQNGYPIGQNRLYHWLRLHKYLFRQENGDHRPYQDWLEKGLFSLEERTYTDGSDTTHLHFTVRVTGKGQRYFIDGFLAGRFKAGNGEV